MTKARDLSKLLSTATGKIAGANLDVSFENISDTGTAGTKVASGTTGQRGSTAGQIRFNTTTGLAEYYDGANFKSIDAPPTVTAVSPLEVESDVGGNVTFTITGTNFGVGAVAKFVGNDATEITASTTTVTNSTTISAIIARSSFVNAKEPYDVKIINGSGLSATLDNQISVDVSPVWSTASGTLATIMSNTTGTHATVSATDTDGDTVSYSETGGTVLTTAGLTLNSSTGAISGDPTDVNTSTTYSFNLRASAGGINVDRAFNIIVNPTLDGSTSARAATSPQGIRDLGITTNGYYYLNPDNTGAGQFYCMFNIGGGNYGFALAMRWYNPYFYGQLLRNKIDGHTGNADGPLITTNSTWNGTAATFVPNSASHVLLAYSEGISSNTFTDYVHTTIAGSPSGNTGFFSLGSTNESFGTTVIAYSVSGWSSMSSPTWHFRDIDGSSYVPSGFSRGLGHNSNVDGTNDLFGALGDSCGSFTSTAGVANISNRSETYIGNRKNVSGSSGAGGSFCSAPNAGSNIGWLMFWR